MADDVRWLSEREQCAWRAFIALQVRLMAQLNRDLQESSGLSNADFAVLVPLSEHPDGRIRVLELARGLQWEKSRLSHQLTRMQQRGLVARSQCDDDRRGAWIELTPDGRAAVEAAAPSHVESVRRYLFDTLSGEQVDALYEIASGSLARLDEVDGVGADVCPATETSAARPGL